MAKPGQPYPAGIDCIWLAEDAAGQLAVFIPGGTGPIPTSVLVASFMPIEDIEDEVLALPAVTRCADRQVGDHEDASFVVELAERGFHVYDWTETQLETGGPGYIYMRVTAPEQPLAARTLRGNMILGSTIVTLAGARFAAERQIDIVAIVACTSID